MRNLIRNMKKDEFMGFKLRMVVIAITPISFIPYLWLQIPVVVIQIVLLIISAVLDKRKFSRK